VVDSYSVAGDPLNRTRRTKERDAQIEDIETAKREAERVQKAQTDLPARLTKPTLC